MQGKQKVSTTHSGKTINRLERQDDSDVKICIKDFKAAVRTVFHEIKMKTLKMNRRIF